jgi:hypothetical protein
MSPTRNHDFVPSVMPFALFPLSPGLTALLICDYIIFDITAAPERITRAMTRYGITAGIPLAPANDTVTAPDTVITLSKGPRTLQLHPGALYELMIECLDLPTWAQANAEILDAPHPPPHRCMPKGRRPNMRDYVPVDDGKEPTDFDEYFDIPAQTDKDIAARVYIKIERDPKRAAILQQRQNAVIMDVLRWARDNRAQLQDQGHNLPEPRKNEPC